MLAASKLARAYRTHLKGPAWAARRAAAALIQRHWRGALGRREAAVVSRRAQALRALRSAAEAMLAEVAAAQNGAPVGSHGADPGAGGGAGGVANEGARPSVQSLLSGATTAGCERSRVAAVVARCERAMGDCGEALARAAASADAAQYEKATAAADVVRAFDVAAPSSGFVSIVASARATFEARQRAALAALAAAAGAHAPTSEVSSLAAAALSLGVLASEVDTLRASAEVRDERLKAQLTAAAETGAQAEVRSLCEQAARLGLAQEARIAEQTLEARRRRAVEAAREAAVHAGIKDFQAACEAAQALGCGADALARATGAFDERRQRARAATDDALEHAKIAGGDRERTAVEDSTHESGDGDAHVSGAQGGLVVARVGAACVELRTLGLDGEAEKAETELAALCTEVERSLRGAARSGTAHEAARACRRAAAVGLGDAVRSAQDILGDRRASAARALADAATRLLPVATSSAVGQDLRAAESALGKAQAAARALNLREQADAADVARAAARQALDLRPEFAPSMAVVANVDAFGMPAPAITCGARAGVGDANVGCVDEAGGLLLHEALAVSKSIDVCSGKGAPVTLPSVAPGLVVTPAPAAAFTRFAAARDEVLHARSNAATARPPSPAFECPPARTLSNDAKKSAGSAGAITGGIELSPDALARAAGGAGAVGGVIALDLGLESLCGVSALRACTSLESLILNVNMLTSNALRGLGRCVALRELSLKDNRITSAEPLAPLANLQVLCLDNNSLTNLDGLGTLPNLRVLSASGNALSSMAGAERCAALERLVASGNALTTLRSARLDKLRRLQHLDVSLNRLADLGEGLPPMLTYLDASHNALAELPAALACGAHSVLCEARLTGNRLSGALTLPPLPRLEVLRVSDNSLSSLRFAERLPCLRELDASFNALSEGAVCAFARLAPCAALRVLHLGDNPVAGEAGYRAVARALLPQLEELDNELLAGAEALAGVNAGKGMAGVGVTLADTHTPALNLSVCGGTGAVAAVSRAGWALTGAERALAPEGCGFTSAPADCADFAEYCEPGASMERASAACAWRRAVSEHWHATSFRGLVRVQRSECARARERGVAAVAARGSRLLEGFGPLAAQAAECTAAREVLHVQARTLGDIAEGAVGGVRFADVQARLIRTGGDAGCAYAARVLRVRSLAAARVQRAWRALLASRQRLHHAAATIQAHWRGTTTRRSQALCALRHEAVLRQHSAARRIQAAIRGRAVRRRIAHALEAARFVDEDEFAYDEVDEAMYMPPEGFDFGPDTEADQHAALSPLASGMVTLPTLQLAQAQHQEPSAVSSISARAMGATSDVIVEAERSAAIEAGVFARREETRRAAKAWIDEARPEGAPEVPGVAQVGDSDASSLGPSASYAPSDASGASPLRLTQAFGVPATEAYQERQRLLSDRRDKKVEKVQSEWGFTSQATAEAFYRAQSRRTRASRAIAKREKMADPTARLQRFKTLAVPHEHVVRAPRGGVSTQRGVHGPSVHLGQGEVYMDEEPLLSSTTHNDNTDDDVSDITLGSQSQRSTSGDGRHGSDALPARTVNNWATERGGAPLVRPHHRGRRGGPRSWK